MKKYKILALFGKSGAGKDTIEKWLVSNNIGHGIVSCTTRPKRDYEIDGIDYNFLSNEDFAQKVLDGTMLEATGFREWFYGTPLEELKEDVVNIGVFNIQGIECLLEDRRLDILPVCIHVDDKERLKRLLKREQSPDCLEICRRFLTDQKDFNNIPFDYLTFDNTNNKKEDFSILLSDYNIQSFLQS